jgi:predicted ATPase
VEAYRAVGSTLFNLGDLGAAQAYLERGMTLYDAQRRHSQEFLYGIEPGVFGLSYAALVLWLLGYPDQALQKGRVVRTLVQELSYPHSLGAARLFAAVSHQLRGERALTQECAETGITLGREHGIPVWLGQGTVLQGWALAEQGQVEEGITQIRRGLATCRAIEAGLLKSYFLVLLAEAYGKAGQIEAGLATLAEALTVVDESGERFYEAELYRLRGELTLQQNRGQGTGDRRKIPTPDPCPPIPKAKPKGIF